MPKLALADGVWQDTGRAEPCNAAAQNPATQPLGKSFLVKGAVFPDGLTAQGGAEGDAQEGVDARAAAARPEQPTRGGDRDIHNQECTANLRRRRRISTGLIGRGAGGGRWAQHNALIAGSR